MSLFINTADEELRTGQSRLESELGFACRGHFQIRFFSINEVMIFSCSVFLR